MPQDTNWIQENRVAFSAKSDFRFAGSIALLHRYERADWNFREEFASSVLRQPNATM
jgi:hypothetical protein